MKCSTYYISFKDMVSQLSCVELWIALAVLQVSAAKAPGNLPSTYKRTSHKFDLTLSLWYVGQFACLTVVTAVHLGAR